MNFLSILPIIIYIDELNINEELKNKLLSILSESESDKEYSDELLSKITKESRINESLRKKCFTIIKKKIDNLHFTFNNILQNLLKS